MKKTALMKYTLAIAVSLLFLVSLFSSFLWGRAENTGEKGKDKGKVILLGFDGLDAGLARRFMDEGLLPHMKKLEEKGTFSPLMSTNPAQSPTAWGSIVTGLNPGKTNIPGFIRRRCTSSMVLPEISTTEDRYQGENHTQPFAKYFWLNRENEWYFLGGCGLAVLLLVFLVSRLFLSPLKGLSGGVKNGAGLAAGLVSCCAVLFFGSTLTGEVPEDVPFPYNLQQGDFFWNVLANHDIRCTDLYAPGAYPCLASKNAKVLGGLGVPDISGSTGTWYVYTDDDWVIQDQDTRTGGRIIKMEKRGGGIRGPIFGPTNFVREFDFENQIQSLRKKKAAGGGPDLGRELNAKEREYRAWRGNPRKRKSTVEFTIKPDRSAGTATITLAGQTRNLTLGKWSDWFQIKFEMSPFVKVPALLRMRMIRCDEEQVRIFVPPLDISPEKTPPYLRISSPENYADQLAGKVGLFKTVGWSCITHGLKDEQISERVFLEDIEFTMSLREKVMKSQLDAGGFDSLMAVFYTPDRVQHMMYRLFDPDHPQYDAKLAGETVRFFGKQIKMKDVIPSIYEQADRIVGEVLDKIHSGDLGDDVTLLIVSDHGFAPFYYGMNVNNFLVEKGYMKLARDGVPITLEDVKDFGDTDFFALVDWDKTKAYSLGLGKVFINLKGREPHGIVEHSEYDSLRDAIIRDLEAYVDPATGKRVVEKAFKRDDIFSGPYWKEGKADFTFNGTKKERRDIDGFADIFIGFNRGYRVSWQTTMGGLEEKTIVKNDMKWSGDHVSVMPALVKGVFFSNAKTGRMARLPAVVDIVPTIYKLFGLSVPKEIDGAPIPLETPASPATGWIPR